MAVDKSPTSSYLMQQGPVHGHVLSDEDARAWHEFRERSLFIARDVEDFVNATIVRCRKHPITAESLAFILLRPTYGQYHITSPRLKLYVLGLLEKGILHAPAVLRALFTFSTSRDRARPATSHANTSERPKPLRWLNSYAVEDAIFADIAGRIRQGKAATRNLEVVQLLTIAAEWVALFNEVRPTFTAEELMGTVSASFTRLKMTMEAAHISLAEFLVALLESPFVHNMMSKPATRLGRRRLWTALGAFLPTAPVQNDLAQRLETARNQRMVELDRKLKKRRETEIEAESIIGPTLVI